MKKRYISPTTKVFKCNFHQPLLDASVIVNEFNIPVTPTSVFGDVEI